MSYLKNFIDADLAYDFCNSDDETNLSNGEKLSISDAFHLWIDKLQLSIFDSFQKRAERGQR